MKEMKSKVYILLDGEKIIRCEGGYTISNISDISEWILVDEGTGDRFNLCQSHYFDGGIYTWDGIPRWKYADDECVLRSDAEIEADRNNILPSPPTEQEQLRADVDFLLVMGGY